MLLIELIIILGCPALVILLTKHNSFFKTIGEVTLCYAIGFLISMQPLSYDKPMAETIASVFVAIAIPLILFSFNIKNIKGLAKNTILSFGLMMISVILVSVIAAIIGTKMGLTDAPIMSGMATGLYIGGTPNLFAIGKALVKGSANVISLAVISDSIFGGIYFLLLVSVIKKIYQKFLGINKIDASEIELGYTNETEYDFSFLTKKNLKKPILALLLAILCFGIGVGIEILINGNIDGSLFIMLGVSILGIVFSLFKPVRELTGSYQIGQYFILVFSLGLSMSFDWSLFKTGIISTLIYFGCIQTASLVLHFILCKIFKIDGGTAIVTSTAGIYGPPFITPVANAYGDKNLIVPGIICGSFGLVVGNIIGIAVGNLLM